MAIAHRIEAFVDVFQRNALGNDSVEIEQTAHVEIDEAREIDREVVHPHDRALELLAR